MLPNAFVRLADHFAAFLVVAVALRGAGLATRMIPSVRWPCSSGDFVPSSWRTGRDHERLARRRDRRHRQGRTRPPSASARPVCSSSTRQAPPRRASPSSPGCSTGARLARCLPRLAASSISSHHMCSPMAMVRATRGTGSLELTLPDDVEEVPGSGIRGGPSRRPCGGCRQGAWVAPNADPRWAAPIRRRADTSTRPSPSSSPLTASSAARYCATRSARTPLERSDGSGGAGNNGSS